MWATQNYEAYKMHLTVWPKNVTWLFYPSVIFKRYRIVPYSYCSQPFENQFYIETVPPVHKDEGHRYVDVVMCHHMTLITES